MTQFLSPVALDFLWESLGAGELPYPLDVRSHGATMDERSALRQRVYQELRDQQLLDGRGRIEPHLEDWLTLLARADHSIDSVFQPTRGEALSALAVGDGALALLATQRDDGLWLRPIDPDSLASAVVDQLPPAGRGPEQSITVPADALSAMEAGRPAGRSPADQKVLAAISAEPKLRAGQLAVNARHNLGGRSRSPVVSWFDTEAGRYMTYTTNDWVTIAPADKATLRHRLNELLRDVSRP